MLSSRGLVALRTLNLLKNVGKRPQIQPARNSSHAWNYRVGPAPPPRGIFLTANLVGGFFWWWVLWHMFTEPGHVFGEFEYPDASKWTDEELGIPTD